MANEIKIDLRIDYLNGAVSKSFVAAVGLTRDVDAEAFAHMAVAALSTGANLDDGVVSTKGYLCAVSRDTAGSASTAISGASGDTNLVALDAGDVCLFRVNNDGGATFLRGTSTPSLEYLIAEGEA